jgi:predicted nucleotidyltransferase
VKLERTLRSITDLIVRCCDPEKVLLFGSYAKAQENADSDLDILVIGNFRESPYLRGHEVQELLRRYPIGIDLHLMTPAEVAVASQKPYGFVNSVLAGSVVLYRKD